MKVLLDACVWGGAARSLGDAGHDVQWTGETEPDPGDEAILLRAFDENRVLITLDKDFGELAIVYGRPHRGIIRLVGLPGRQQGANRAPTASPCSIVIATSWRAAPSSPRPPSASASAPATHPTRNRPQTRHGDRPSNPVLKS